MKARSFSSGMMGVVMWGLTVTAVFGEAEIRNVNAGQQRWPWNGKVDICYDVVGEVPVGFVLFVTATDHEKNVEFSAETRALSGDTGTEEGTHRVVWNLDQQNIRIQSTNVTFKVNYDWPLYCVVNLSEGADASSYPVVYMNDPPSGGFNTDEYKTTKLVLRRIDPGTFMMGGQYQTTLTKPYYIGLFEVTQSQYELVTWENPSSPQDDKKPVNSVSWNTIRGNTNWPSSSAVALDSFMGRLRAKTALAFDLPTEAQWEYACRAGTTSTYSYGDIADSHGNYMVGGGWNLPWEVGRTRPNAWGLYDMHGNVAEWCLDWRGSLANGATNPVGMPSGTYRVTRGGSYASDVSGCTSSWRGGCEPTFMGRGLGFRILRTLPE